MNRLAGQRYDSQSEGKGTRLQSGAMTMRDMNAREQIHRLVDALPDDALDTAAKVLNGLSVPSLADPVTSALAKAPIDDEPVTDGEAEAIEEGERDVADGEVITAAALRVRLGL